MLFLGQFQLIDFFPSFCVIFSCFFVCLVIWDWVSDIVNFTSLGAGYFCSPINVLEFCSVMHSNYLETV